MPPANLRQNRINGFLEAPITPMMGWNANRQLHGSSFIIPTTISCRRANIMPDARSLDDSEETGNYSDERSKDAEFDPDYSAQASALIGETAPPFLCDPADGPATDTYRASCLPPADRRIRRFPRHLKSVSRFTRTADRFGRRLR
jgi:hypothetical protein